MMEPDETGDGTADGDGAERAERLGERVHVPVMLAEVLEWLDPQPGQTFVDGTLGAGGHTRAIAEAVGPEGTVVSLDRDPAARAAAETNLRGLPIMLVDSSYADLPRVLEQLEIPAVDGILLDLGLSSDQLEDDERGFSLRSTGPLDMRFDPREGESVAEYLAKVQEEDLANAIFRYGEERNSRRIARAIVRRRATQPIETAADLTDIVHSVMRRPGPGQIDSATRTFQALRIAVNGELDALERALQTFPNLLAPDGRLAMISFHSLEDRPIKQAFRDDLRLDVLTRKPIRPSAAEVDENPRARSAKLRVATRV